MAMFRAVPASLTTRFAATKRRLSRMPFAHQKYATRLPRAKASGVHDSLRSGFNCATAFVSRRAMSRRREGLSAKELNGFLRTASATSFPVKTVTLVETPSRSAIAFSIRAPSSPPLFLTYREDDVSAVQQCPNVAIPKAFEELSKVRHRDALRLADIDPAKKRYPSINHRSPPPEVDWKVRCAPETTGTAVTHVEQLRMPPSARPATTRAP